MQIIKGTICKEELKKFIDSVDWGEPRKNGKHYISMIGFIDTLIDGEAFNCFLEKSRPFEAQNAPREILFKGRTAALHKEFYRQRKEYFEQFATYVDPHTYDIRHAGEKK